MTADFLEPSRQPGQGPRRPVAHGGVVTFLSNLCPQWEVSVGSICCSSCSKGSRGTSKPLDFQPHSMGGSGHLFPGDTGCSLAESLELVTWQTCQGASSPCWDNWVKEVEGDTPVRKRKCIRRILEDNSMVILEKVQVYTGLQFLICISDIQRSLNIRCFP